MCKLEMTPCLCHMAIEEALLCCLQPGDLMVRENKNLFYLSGKGSISLSTHECLLCGS